MNQAVLRRRNSDVLLKSSGKMGLVSEAAGKGDFCEARIRSRKQCAGKLNSQCANLFSQREAVRLPERTGEVNGVYTNRFGNVIKSYCFGEVGVHVVESLTKPFGSPMFPNLT